MRADTMQKHIHEKHPGAAPLENTNQFNLIQAANSEDHQKADPEMLSGKVQGEQQEVKAKRPQQVTNLRRIVQMKSLERLGYAASALSLQQQLTTC
jgi:hypothetical protein